MSGMNGVVEIDAGEDGEHAGLQKATSSSERGQPNGHCRQGEHAADPTDRAERSTEHDNEACEHFQRAQWPASMLANRRTLCDTGRDRKEMISIETTSGRI